MIDTIQAIWDWMKENGPAVSILLTATGSGILGWSSLSIRNMQAEKRREEKHEIGKLTTKEMYLLGNANAGWVVVAGAGGQLYDFKGKIHEPRSFGSERFMVSVNEFGASMRRLLVYGLLEFTEDGSIVRTVWGDTFNYQIVEFFEKYPEARSAHFWNRVRILPWYRRLWNRILRKKEYEVMKYAEMFWPCGVCGRTDRERPYRRQRDVHQPMYLRRFICHPCSSHMEEENFMPPLSGKSP